MPKYMPPLEEFDRGWVKALNIGYPREWVQGLGAPDMSLYEGSFDWRQIAAHQIVANGCLACPHSMLLDACAQLSGIRLSTFRSSCHFCGLAFPKDSIGEPGLPVIRFSACRVLYQRLSGQLELTRLRWTKADQRDHDNYKENWGAHLLAADKGRRIGNGDWRTEYYQSVFEKLEGGLIKAQLIAKPSRWPRKRVLRLVQNHLDSLGVVVGMAEPEQACLRLRGNGTERGRDG
jgi:hypothetical protein